MEYYYHRSISVMLSKKKKNRRGKIEMLMWPKLITEGINMIRNGASKDLDEEAASSKKYVS